MSCRGQHSDVEHVGPGFDRGAIAESRMQTLSVVEHFDVVEHCRFRLLMGTETSLVDLLLLERGEEAFHWRVMCALKGALGPWADPTRQLSFQPEAPGADQEVTKGLK